MYSNEYKPPLIKKFTPATLTVKPRSGQGMVQMSLTFVLLLTVTSVAGLSVIEYLTNSCKYQAYRGEVFTYRFSFSTPTSKRGIPYKSSIYIAGPDMDLEDLEYKDTQSYTCQSAGRCKDILVTGKRDYRNKYVNAKLTCDNPKGCNSFTFTMNFRNFDIDYYDTGIFVQNNGLGREVRVGIGSCNSAGTECGKDCGFENTNHRVVSTFGESAKTVGAIRVAKDSSALWSATCMCAYGYKAI